MDVNSEAIAFAAACLPCNLTQPNPLSIRESALHNHPEYFSEVTLARNKAYFRPVLIWTKLSDEELQESLLLRGSFVDLGKRLLAGGRF